MSLIGDNISGDGTVEGSEQKRSFKGRHGRDLIRKYRERVMKRGERLNFLMVLVSDGE